VDAKSYDDWARRIAGGDWVGEGVFYQAPGYPYFLAVVYGLVGGDPWRAHLAQMALGAASCVLVYLATSRLFDRTTGIVAGLGLALYPPAIFFDGLIQKAGLGLFVLCLLLLGIARFIERQSAARALACGAAVGWLALVRENALVFALVLPFWMLAGFRECEPRHRLRWVAGLALGLVLVLVPVGLRNLAVGGTFALTTSQMGTNFYIGNHEGATGSYLPLIPGRHTPRFEGSDARLLAERAEGRELSAGEVSQYWLGRSFEFVVEHPGEWVALMLRKALMTVNAFEIPDAEDIYVYAEQSWVLRGLLPLWHLGVLMALAAGGAVLARSRGRDVWVLGLLAAAFWASVVLFYVFARYRFPLVPLLLPLAAFGAVEGVRRARAGDRSQLRAVLAAVAVAGLLANLPLFDREPFKLASYTNWAHVLLQEGQLPEAEHYLDKARAVDPQNVDLEMHLAVLRFEQDRLDDAAVHASNAMRLEPGDHRPHLLLARIARAQGRPEEAKRHRREARRLMPAPAQPGSSVRSK
jgi:4-amino-4-deoxy-L-arabinose transferase-like glycosyltransferase